MKTHYDLSDQEFASRFAACTLDPELFTHEAHLRLVWILLNDHGLTNAIEITRSQLIAFTAKVGASDKYHETLTVAAVHVVNHFNQQSTKSSFPEFLIEFPRLKTHFRELLRSHYSDEILNLSDSSRHYIEPDLVPFS